MHALGVSPTGADAGWLPWLPGQPPFCFEIFYSVLLKILNLFDISFKKGLVKGWLPNEINKRAISDAEISDNRIVPQVGYDQALFPRLHDIFDFLCFFSS